MKILFKIIYPFACILLPCIIYQIVLSKKNKIFISKKHSAWCFIFLTYIFLALTVAGVGSIWDIGIYDTIIRTDEINLIPFNSEGVITYILNIIMFMPLGFLIPLIWNNFRSMSKVCLSGFLFSLSIEICQLFNGRSSDIDDLMMNTLGTLAGYIIWLAFNKIFFRNKSSKDYSLSKLEPAVYLILSILGELFLYNWQLTL